MKEAQYLSKERLDQLKEELESLRTKKRAEIAERLKLAKEFGDLSENSEYSEAREEQTRVENRIFELEELLKEAIVVKKGAARGVVSVGCTITVKKGTKTLTYEIVGSQEADPVAGKISNESPLGSAFMGKKAGDTVSVQTPAGTASYEILKLE